LLGLYSEGGLQQVCLLVVIVVGHGTNETGGRYLLQHLGTEEEEEEAGEETTRVGRA
jgi:hypothetical protein